MPREIKKLRTFLGDEVWISAFDVNSNQCTIFDAESRCEYTISRSRIIATDDEILRCVTARSNIRDQVVRDGLISMFNEAPQAPVPIRTARIPNATLNEQVQLPPVRSEDGGSQSEETTGESNTRDPTYWSSGYPTITDGTMGSDTSRR